jgi:hypothetical protein
MADDLGSPKSRPDVRIKSSLRSRPLEVDNQVIPGRTLPLGLLPLRPENERQVPMRMSRDGPFSDNWHCRDHGLKRVETQL